MLKYFLIQLRCLLTTILLLVIILLVLVYYYSRNLPDYSQLTHYQPPSVTRIYSRDGKLIEEYALEHRVFVPITSIPKLLIEAFIAAEDKNFYNHSGVDVISIIRAVIANIPKLINNRRMEGGSTITQQVVKNFLLTNERSLNRKIKEAILSYTISKTFSKEQILELYLNQTFFGRRSYGVAAASQNYFNKSLDELNLPETALIAALPKAPATYDPEKNYQKSKERRDYVLTRMYEEGYITEEIKNESINSPIIINKRNLCNNVSADYYAEQVREEVIKLVGKKYFYTGGLTIVTPLDFKMQAAVNKALKKAIREYDKRYGFRGKITAIKLNDWVKNLNSVEKPNSMLEYKLAVVLAVYDQFAKIGLQDGTICKMPINNIKWAKLNLSSIKSILSPGDVVAIEILNKNCFLRQIPQVNGAMIVIDPNTGSVLATQGGYDFSSNKFDGVTQALRQPGSLVKTFVYLAALENGIQPNQIFDDAPISIPQGLGMSLWQPKNYKNDFLGPMTFRQGLEKSRNLVTVRVAQEIGLEKIASIIKRFGINDAPKLYYSMILGSFETTLEKMSIAYAIIANNGKKIKPQYIEFIKDRNGKIIYKRDNRICKSCIVNFDDTLADALPPQLLKEETEIITDEASNYQITSILTGVASRGTAAAINRLDKIVACKTGTTNNSKDTWLVCFTPRIVVGIRIGFDIPKDMGKTAMGSNIPMPAMMDFMEMAFKEIPSIPFKVPKSIKLIPINLDNGKLYSGLGSIVEAFKTNEKEESNIFNKTNVNEIDQDSLEDLEDIE